VALVPGAEVPGLDAVAPVARESAPEPESGPEPDAEPDPEPDSAERVQEPVTAQ
jgi:hypothetical protein